MGEESRVLVAGGAGFIGGNLMHRLQSAGTQIMGIDNFSEYYSPGMKHSRLKALNLGGSVQVADIQDLTRLKQIFSDFRPHCVINLAAQGGVRASRTDPLPYLETNQIGFYHLLKLSREFEVEKFIFASSSSVYGDILGAPFTEDRVLQSPKSIYALSKMSNELMAQHFPRNDMSIFGLRFFTVYGPWGRPDMAMFRLLASAKLNKDFYLTASSQVSRDFTYVDDVSVVIEVLISRKNSTGSFEILNVAGSHPYSLQNLFEIVRDLGLITRIIQSESDPQDVALTHGSTLKLESMGLTVPQTSLPKGVENTVAWLNALEKSELESWFNYNREP